MEKNYSSDPHSFFIFPEVDKTRFLIKIFYLFIFVTLLPINASAQQWHYFKELPANAVPKSVASNNAGTLFLLTTDNKVFYKTTEGSWTNITYWGLVSAESISADKTSNRVYIGTSSQGLFYSSDLGASWQSIWMETHPSSGHHEGYGSFTQTGNPNLFFAGHLGMPKITVFTGQGASGSVKTISGNPNASPSALYYTNDEKLLVGNHLGIWISANNGNSFSQTNHSSGHVFGFTQDENGRAYALNRNISTQEITLLYSDDYSNWSLMELPDPGEAYTTIFYNSGTQELWLGSTQGIYSSPVQNNNWVNKNFNNSSHSVRQILNDHNGGLYNFSLEHAVQKLNDVNDGWIDMTQGLSGVVDDLVFSSENVLFAYNYFFSNKVSILANPSQNWIGSRLGSELSGVRNLFITEDGMVFGNTHKKVFRIEGSGPTFTEFSPPEEFSTQTSGGISIFKKGLHSGIFITHSFIPQKIFGSFDNGNNWQVISDISASGLFSSFTDFSQDAGGRFYLISENTFKVYISQTGDTWDLVPFDYEDFSVSFAYSQFQSFGTKTFITDSRQVFEIITEDNVTSIVSIPTPFVSSENPITDFKYTGTGSLIINTYINGVYQSSDNGQTWEHFGFPVTWVNDNTPLTTIDSHDTLPFIVMKENNAQNIAPGIYYYFPDILSTDNFEAKGGIYLYPNPVTSKLHVQSTEEIKSITIFDSSGRVVLSSSGNDENIDVSALSKGYYIIVVNTVEGSRFKGKFIKK